MLSASLKKAAWFAIFLGQGESLAKECPKTIAQWVQWQESAIEKLKRNRDFLDLKPIASFLQKCQAPKEFDSCLQPLKRFSSKVFDVHKPGQSLGLTISDQDYLKHLKEQNRGSLPQDFLSSDFLNLFEQVPFDFPKIIAKVKSLAKNNGFHHAIAFPYSSRHLPSIDPAKTYKRFFILLEKDETLVVSQWNIGTTTGKPPATISVIQIDKVQELAYFHDLYRVRDESGIKVLSRLEVNRRMEDCQSCHKSAFIPIVPDDSFDFPSYKESLAQANAIMKTYRKTKQAFKAKPKDQEPYLGIKEGGCGSIQGEEALALRCQNCHHPKNNNPLTFPSGLNIQLPGRTNLVEQFVIHKRTMPPWFHEKSQSFSRLIYQCVIEDLYGSQKKTGRLFEYLENRQCVDPFKDSRI